jgi:hypothetical protein
MIWAIGFQAEYEIKPGRPTWRQHKLPEMLGAPLQKLSKDTIVFDDQRW